MAKLYTPGGHQPFPKNDFMSMDIVSSVEYHTVNCLKLTGVCGKANITTQLPTIGHKQSKRVFSYMLFLVYFDPCSYNNGKMYRCNNWSI